MLLDQNAEQWTAKVMVSNLLVLFQVSKSFNNKLLFDRFCMETPLWPVIYGLG